MPNIPMISLKAARVNAKLSQRKAAEMLGISVSTLQSYESGDTTPDVLTANKIGELYAFPTDLIFFGKSTA